jgi:PLP dependent protein
MLHLRPRERICPCLGEESTKGGVAEQDLAALAESVAPFAHIDLIGLMAIPPFPDNPEQVRPYFRKLRQLRDDVSRRIRRELPVLSMGMSYDFEIAIEEGATEIRLGTALFGERKPKP